MFVRSTLVIAAFLLPFQFTNQPSGTPGKTPPLQTERFARDVRDKNVGDILSVFTMRAEVLSPDGKALRGEEQIRKNFEDQASQFDTDLRLQRTGFERTGTFGIEHGTYTQVLRQRSTGQMQESRGTYTFVHERQPNGEWHIARQKWTTGN